MKPGHAEGWRDIGAMGDTVDEVADKFTEFIEAHGGHYARLVHWGTTPTGHAYAIRCWVPPVSDDTGPR